MNYWSKKEELKQRAREHTAKMHLLYGDEIDEAVKSSKVFDDDVVNEDRKNSRGLLGLVPMISFKKKTTVDALFSLPAKCRVALLNFASYKNPGGMFINGSSAQEESLCHASYLYNVLNQFPSYYLWNIQHKNRGLYLNRAIYSPDIRFFKGNRTRMADVLTCAAPNNSLYKYGRFTEEDNDLALMHRIQFIFDVLNSMRDEPPAVVILGSFGCGVFKQRVERVAEFFAENCDSVTMGIQEIVFAIPDDSINPFRESFLDSAKYFDARGEKCEIRKEY